MHTIQLSPATTFLLTVCAQQSGIINLSKGVSLPYRLTKKVICNLRSAICFYCKWKLNVTLQASQMFFTTKYIMYEYYQPT